MQIGMLTTVPGAGRFFKAGQFADNGSVEVLDDEVIFRGEEGCWLHFDVLGMSPRCLRSFGQLPDFFNPDKPLSSRHDCPFTMGSY